MPLFESGRERIGNDYSPAAYRLFPRYRLDEAIEVEIERITGQQFHSLEEARNLLLDAGSRALSALFQEFEHKASARAALIDEWKTYEAYLHGLKHSELTQIEALPYRRVLPDSERQQLRQTLK